MNRINMNRDNEKQNYLLQLPEVQAPVPHYQQFLLLSLLRKRPSANTTSCVKDNPKCGTKFKSRCFNCSGGRYLQILVDLQLTTVRSKKIVDFLIVDFHVGDTDEVFSVYRLRREATPSNAEGVRTKTRGIIVCILLSIVKNGIYYECFSPVGRGGRFHSQLVE